MVIDDDQMMRAVIRIHLERSDFDVVLAENGEKAKTESLKSNPDAFIVDLMMPEVDGCQFLKWMRSQGELKDKPAIMLTAVGDTNLLATMGENLADAVHRKPIQGQALVGVLRQLLDGGRKR